jgi:O-antigen ligase
MTILSNTVIIKRILIAVLMGLVVVSPLIVFGFVFEYKGVGTALDCMQITNNFCMSGTGRFTIWNTVIEDTLTDNYLLFGYGYSVYFNDLAEVYLSNIGLGGFIPNDPHNGFIDIFSAMGVFGVLLYTSILLMSIAGLWRLNENEFVFFSVFLFVYVVSNFTESYFLKSTNIYPVLFYFYLNYYWKQRL